MTKPNEKTIWMNGPKGYDNYVYRPKLDQIQDDIPIDANYRVIEYVIEQIQGAASNLIDPRCHLEIKDDYGDSSACFVVRGWRPMTDEEKHQIKDAEQTDKERTSDRERQEYDRLRKKFES